MSHFIWILDNNNNTLLLLASLVTAFQRKETGTLITLANGIQILSNSAPESIEEKLNTYYNNAMNYLKK